MGETTWWAGCLGERMWWAWRSGELRCFVEAGDEVMSSKRDVKFVDFDADNESEDEVAFSPLASRKLRE